jgi:hypothetical protein
VSRYVALLGLASLSAFVPLSADESALRPIAVENLRGVAVDVAEGVVSLAVAPGTDVALSGGAAVEIVQADRTLTLRRTGGLSGEVLVLVPEDVPVSVRVGRGRVHASRLYGHFSAEVAEGDVLLDGCTGAFDLSVRRGNIRAAVFLNDESRFRVDEGSVRLDLLDAVARDVEVSVGRGGVRIALALGYSANLEATTLEGAIRTRVPAETRISPGEDSGGKRMVGALGAGGPRLRLSTEQGNIEIVPLDSGGEAAQVPVLSAPYAPRGVLVDGMLEAAWLDARPAPILDASGAVSAEVRALWDRNRLYVAAIAYESAWGATTFRATEPDSTRIFDDDAVDIYITGEDADFRLTVNVLGTVFDAKVLHGEEDVFWNSRATAQSALYRAAWVVEIGMPHVSFGWLPEAGTRLGWNVHRVRSAGAAIQSWAPDEGALLLAPERPPDEGTAPLVLRGLEAVSPQALALAAPVPPAGLVRPDDLSFIERYLSLLGWFDRVEALIEGPAADGAPVEAVVEASGLRAQRVTDVRTEGARAAPADEWRARFGFVPGWHSDAVLEHRRSMAERAYREAGYPYATVRARREGSTLYLEVNEGVIDEVRVVGERQVPERSVREAIRPFIGRAYHEEMVAEALATTRAALSARHRAFRDVADQGLDRAGERNVWVLRVDERAIPSASAAPFLRFSRVHGWEVGIGTRLRYREGGNDDASPTHVAARASYVQHVARLDGEARHMNYALKALAHVNAAQTVSVGASYARETRAHPWQRPPGVLGMLDAAAFGTASADYLSAEGVEAMGRAFFHPRVIAEARTGLRKDRSLLRATRWSLFAPGRARSNRRITDGESQYAQFRLLWDARDVRTLAGRPFDVRVLPSAKVRNGAWAEAVFESRTFRPAALSPAGGKSRGEWTYSLLWLDLRGYATVGERHVFGVRGTVQLASDALPAQQQAWVGGSETLRSRAFADWPGDNALVARVEYQRLVVGERGTAAPPSGDDAAALEELLRYRRRLQLSEGRWFFGAFLDAATVWNSGARPQAGQVRQAAGISIGRRFGANASPSLDQFTLDIAVPLGASRRGGESVGVWLRTTQTF